MANYNDLKTAIQAVIKANGNQEITGDIMQNALMSMINSLGAGYQFIGVATPETNPSTPDQKVFYIANGKGTYSNFGGLIIDEDEVIILYYDTAWHKLLTGIATAAQLNQLGQEINDVPIYNWEQGGFDPVYMTFDDNPNYAHSTPVNICGNYLAFQNSVRWTIYYNNALEIVDYSDQKIDQEKVERYPYASIVTTQRGIIYTSATPYDGILPRLNNLEDTGKITKTIDNFYYSRGGYDIVNHDFDNNPNYVHTNLIDVTNNILQIYNGGNVRMVLYYDSFRTLFR